MVIKTSISFPNKLIKQLKKEHIRYMSKEEEAISFSKFVCDKLRKNKNEKLA